MIRKIGNQFVLYSKTGKKILGRFKSKKAAQSREKQVKRYSRRY